MSAAEAHRIGPINHVAPAEELDEKVYDLARWLAAGTMKLIRWMRQVLG
jgi:enoyl-CoA hydratase/carnithine racemase